MRVRSISNPKFGRKERRKKEKDKSKSEDLIFTAET
jgi:hypothetical protein